MILFNLYKERNLQQVIFFFLATMDAQTHGLSLTHPSSLRAELQREDYDNLKIKN